MTDEEGQKRILQAYFEAELSKIKEESEGDESVLQGRVVKLLRNQLEVYRRELRVVSNEMGDIDEGGAAGLGSLLLEPIEDALESEGFDFAIWMVAALAENISVLIRIAAQTVPGSELTITAPFKFETNNQPVSFTTEGRGAVKETILGGEEERCLARQLISSIDWSAEHPEQQLREGFQESDRHAIDTYLELFRLYLNIPVLSIERAALQVD